MSALEDKTSQEGNKCTMVLKLRAYCSNIYTVITGLRMETNTIFDGTVDMVLYGTAVHVNR